MSEIKVNVKLSPEYQKRLDKLRADMKAYSRKQVWEECTCKNCKWWHEEDEVYKRRCLNLSTDDMVGTDEFTPTPDFGCNQWEENDN